MADYDECYELLEEYSEAVRNGKQPPLSKTMRRVISAAANWSADDPHNDDRHYDKFIPSKVLDNGCSRYHAVEGLMEIFKHIGEAYECKKNPTPEVILQMVYGQGRYEWEYNGKAAKYLEAEGTVEDALGAVCSMARIAIGDGEFEEYDY